MFTPIVCSPRMSVKPRGRRMRGRDTPPMSPLSAETYLEAMAPVDRAIDQWRGDGSLGH